VVVSSSSEVVQTQSSTISSTINANQIIKLPLTSRSAMDFVTFLPGVATPGGNRQSQINGLPRGMINITLDGVNIQDNTLRTTDGFFSIVSPRLDAIEEVTVTTAAQGTESAQGAVQIKFVTRSGTNTFAGSAYHYYRNDRLNANTWFNNRDGVDKPELLQNQTGVRAGGPIVIPGLINGRNRAFFFFNYEEFRQPGAVTRNRTILNARARQGIYSYVSGGNVQSVNLLSLAAENRQTATADPTIAALLNDIASATGGGSLSPVDPNLEQFRYNVSTTSLRRYPTVRVDLNLNDKHRFTSAFNYNYFTDFPDTLNNRDSQFPGFPVEAGQSSERYGWSNTLRSTLTQNMVNEVRVGYSGAPVSFFNELNAGMWSGTLANQGGFNLDFGAVGSNLTDPAAAPSPQSRNASNLLIENTLTWLRGTHSVSVGGSWTQFDLWAKNSALLPTIGFGTFPGDPAQAMFTTDNFPGAAATNLTAAQNLYALLTGRVDQINGDARLDEATNEYAYMGTGTQRARMREAGVFLQDAWRVRPNLTINAGLRYELQFPFYPLNDSYSTATIADLCGLSGVGPSGRCNLFQAGHMPGKHPEFVKFSRGTRAYDVDYDNFAPSLGVAWTIGGGSGGWRRITGSELVVRAGYTRAFNRNGMNDFSGQYNGNPGVSINDPDRDVDLGNLDNDGRGFPVLFREQDRLGAAPFPRTPAYPLHDVVTGDINVFDPSIKVPYADTWTIGVQRGIGAATAVEARYVGTRSRDNWQVLNYNEINIFDNGFLDEFRRAQQNLQANLAAARGANFRYFGPGTGTVPLPTILAHVRANANPNDPAHYNSAAFASNTFLTPLARFNPNPFGFANSLYNDASRRANAAAAGIPANYFLANPDLQGGADLTTNEGTSDYHGLQLELRRRLSHGLQASTSYAFGKGTLSQFETFRRPRFSTRDTGSPGDLTHAFKANVIYDLPFGRGRRIGGGANGFVDRVIGGWSIAWAGRIQSGTLVDLGNVRLFGMTREDVQNMFKLRFDDANKQIYMLPQDVIDETIKAFSVSATSATGYGSLGPPSGRYFGPANGPDCIEPDAGDNNNAFPDYGECGARELVVTGPLFHQHDISVSKRVNLVGRTNLEFHVEMLNAFNHPNFNPVGGIGTQISGYRVTGLNGANTSRVIQFVSRINW
jgi:hypothetical protein